MVTNKRKMVKSFKVLIVMMAVLLSFGAVSVYAESISVSSLDVQESNGAYIAVVLLENEDVSSEDAELLFSIDGVESKVDIVVDTETSEQTFVLSESLDNYDELVSGESYTLTVSVGDSNVSDTFMFGSLPEEEGLPISITSVEVDGTQVNDYSSISVENGQTVDVRVSFLGVSDADNARLRADIEGYEHSTISDATSIFSITEGVSSSKVLSLELPEDMDSEKKYILKVYGSNDLSGLTYKEYSLYIDTQRHRVDITDLVMSPQTGVEAGQAVISNVRIVNRGQRDQDSVKVIVEVPELNIRASSYVTNLEVGDTITSEDMYLGVPLDAEAGIYTANVYTQYNGGYTESVESFDFVVLASSRYTQDRLIISAGNVERIVAGQESSFEIIVGNPSSQSKAISVVPANMNWAVVSASPSFAMVQAGADETYEIKIMPYGDIRGTQTLSLLVKEENDVVKELNIPVVFEDPSTTEEVGGYLMYVLLAFVAIVLVVLLIALVMRLLGGRGGSRGDTFVAQDSNDSADDYY